MKIIRESIKKYQETPYIGECEACGCVFETTLFVFHALDGSFFGYTKDDLLNLEIRGNTFTCFCPCCNIGKRVKLKERTSLDQ